MRARSLVVCAFALGGCTRAARPPAQPAIAVAPPVRKETPPPRPTGPRTDARGAVKAVAASRLPKFITAAGDRVFWSNGAGELSSVALYGGEVIVHHEVKGASRALAGVVASDGEAVYFATQVGIFKLPLHERHPELHIPVPDALSVAVDDRYLYFTRFNHTRIWRVAKEGGSPEVLVRRTRLPSSLTPSGDYLYWSSYGDGTVNRVHRDSKVAKVLGRSRHPTGLAVLGDRIVWASEQGAVYSKLIDAGRRQRKRAIADGEHNHDVFASDGTFAYYGSWRPKGKGRVVRITASGTVDVIAEDLRSPVGITVVGGSVFVANKGEDTIVRIDKGSRLAGP